MSIYKEDCENRQCGHSKEAHLRRTTVRPVLGVGNINEVRIVYGKCTMPFCDCDEYESPFKTR